MDRWVYLVAPYAVRPDGAAIAISGHAPKPGAQARAVLARIGYSEAVIAAMINTGAAAEGRATKYLSE